MTFVVYLPNYTTHYYKLTFDTIHLFKQQPSLLSSTSKKIQFTLFFFFLFPLFPPFFFFFFFSSDNGIVGHQELPKGTPAKADMKKIQKKKKKHNKTVYERNRSSYYCTDLDSNIVTAETK